MLACAISPQVVLKASAGMNYWEFVQFLCLISKARLNTLKEALSHKSDLLEYFNGLDIQITKLFTRPPQAITFLKTFEDFANIVTLHKVESVVEKCALSPKNEQESNSVSIPFSKLVDRLPKSLQDRLNVMVQNDSKTVSFAEVISFVFRAYELHVINILLQDVLDNFIS